MKCPRCGTVVEKPAVGAPVCPNCGFGSTGAPAAASLPPPAPTFAPAPEPAYPPPVAFSGTPFGTPQAPAAPKQNGMAIAAMVIGIVSCCIWVVPFMIFVAVPGGILALVLGIVALRRANREPARYGGKGMAITGIVLGGLMILVGVLVLAVVGSGGFEEFIDEYCADNPEDPNCEDRATRQPDGQAPLAAAARPWWDGRLAWPS